LYVYSEENKNIFILILVFSIVLAINYFIVIINVLSLPGKEKFIVTVDEFVNKEAFDYGYLLMSFVVSASVGFSVISDPMISLGVIITQVV